MCAVVEINCFWDSKRSSGRPLPAPLALWAVLPTPTITLLPPEPHCRTLKVRAMLTTPGVGMDN